MFLLRVNLIDRRKDVSIFFVSHVSCFLDTSMMMINDDSNAVYFYIESSIMI